MIRRWRPQEGASEFLGRDSGVRGPNGLTLDPQGRLIICEQVGRRVSRREHDGHLSLLADKFEGKRLNSPNDCAHRSDGALYFTDPPFGLAKQDADPAKELPFSGIYRLAKGELQLLSTELRWPNGLAFSPDEKHLYVANSEREHKLWMRFDVRVDGALRSGTVFHDASGEKSEGLADGLKVDVEGRLYCTGPGGIWIFSSEGKHLGTIVTPEAPANCAWGDPEGRTLYITARTGLYRIRLKVPGIRPFRRGASFA